MSALLYFRTPVLLKIHISKQTRLQGQNKKENSSHEFQKTQAKNQGLFCDFFRTNIFSKIETEYLLLLIPAQ